MIAAAIFLTTETHAQEEKVDSLILRHCRTGGIAVIKKYHHKLYITTEDKQIHYGRFLYRTKDYLFFSEKQQSVKIRLDSIRIIQYRHNVLSAITESVIKLPAMIWLAMLGTTSALSGAIVIDNNKGIGIGLMTLSVPLLYGSYRLYKSLSDGKGWKFKLGKKWKIVNITKVEQPISD